MTENQLRAETILTAVRAFHIRIAEAEKTMADLLAVERAVVTRHPCIRSTGSPKVADRRVP